MRHYYSQRTSKTQNADAGRGAESERPAGAPDFLLTSYARVKRTRVRYHL